MATGAEGAGRGPSSSSGGSGQSWSKLVVHHTRGLSCLHYDAHDQLLVVVSYDGHVRVYNLARRRLARDWTNPNHCLFTCAVYDRVKGQILTGDERGYLSIFSMEHGQCLLTIPATSAPLVALVPCLALGAATYALVSRQQVELWEVTQGLDHSFIGGGHTRAVLAIHTSSLWDLVSSGDAG
jgi:WD40 repeat protein